MGMIYFLYICSNQQPSKTYLASWFAIPLSHMLTLIRYTFYYSICFQVSGDAVKSGIRLNAICPAFVDTPMFRNLAAGDSKQTEGGDLAKVKAFIEHVGVMR